MFKEKPFELKGFFYVKNRKMSKGHENLIPPRSKDEARERGQKGGIASGEARRKKKTIRETLEMMLAGQMPDGSTRRDAIVVALMEKALSGDVRAFEAIRDSIGEKPVNTVSGPAGEPLVPPSINVIFKDC